MTQSIAFRNDIPTGERLIAKAMGTFNYLKLPRTA
jgi:hypothetical protein